MRAARVVRGALSVALVLGAASGFPLTASAAGGGLGDVIAVSATPDGDGDSGGAWGPISTEGARRMAELERVSGSPFEAAGKDHYNKHPNRRIGHFALATGYANEGRTGTMLDPAAGLQGGYEDSAKKFSLTVTDIAFFTAERGVVA